MNISRSVLALLSLLLASSALAATQLGDLTTRAHAVSGQVWAVSDKVLEVRWSDSPTDEDVGNISHLVSSSTVVSQL